MQSVTFQGKSLTLVGRKIHVGDIAPNFRVVTHDLQQKSLIDFEGKIKVLTSFPSLDTSVCDLQVKEFNKRAEKFSQEVVMLAISKDLPFAQARFCAHFAIKNLYVLSDYKTSSFGINYGLLIKELNLLARSVILLDKSDQVRYIQIVDELSHSPNYEEVIKNLAEVVQNPIASEKPREIGHCLPCEGKEAALSKEKIQEALAQVKGWQLVEEKKIIKEFLFESYGDAKYFLDLIALIAEEQSHHPTLTLTYRKLKVVLTTHAAAGVTKNDFIMAKIIDSLQNKEV